MDDAGNMKEDLQLPSGTDASDKLADELQAAFDDGKEIIVTVLKVSNDQSTIHVHVAPAVHLYGACRQLWSPPSRTRQTVKYTLEYRQTLEHAWTQRTGSYLALSMLLMSSVYANGHVASSSHGYRTCLALPCTRTGLVPNLLLLYLVTLVPNLLLLYLVTL